MESASEQVAVPTERATRGNVLVAAAVGQLVEWYDFAVYGFSVPIIAHLFFPSQSKSAALMLVFAVYGVAFVMRPLGGLVFGVWGDKVGRQRVLSVIILLVGASTAAIGALPGYATIGVAAPILLTLCRLLQGFSAGGEAIGASSFVIESAPSHRRGVWIGFVIAMSVVPVIVAGQCVGLLSQVMSASGFESWGWRIPFLISLPLSIVGLYIRLATEDGQGFITAKSSGQLSAAPIRDSLTRDMRSVMFVFVLAGLTSLAYYMLAGYFYTFLQVTVGLPKSEALTANTVGMLVTVVGFPVCGWLSDIIGRKPMVLIGSSLLALAGIPAFAVAAHGGFTSALLAQFLLGLSISVFGGGAYVAMVELFPATTRFTGGAIGYNAAYAAFGGTAPLMGSFLVAKTGYPTAPGFYLTMVAIIALLVFFRMPETYRSNVGRST
ncbi:MULTISPECIES: MFS transporter [unclassified Caballeronia]|uniref:MFS transporter n=1 Tax=unclassified Caballeronia TaxID=2646786 RepID=UPI0020297E22|nr:MULTISPECIES: MFS transporter [unclassified Caballeronia]